MDWEDDLLALAEAPAPKKKKKQKKRKREESTSDVDMDISEGSDEEVMPSKDDDEDEDNEEEVKGPKAYPLEGLYKNAADKAALAAMTELEREEILEERRAEIESYNNRQLLKQLMSKDKDDDDYEDDKPARRKTASAKTRQLDELKRRRKAKSEKDERRARRREEGEDSDDENAARRSPTPFDFSSDDDEGEDSYGAPQKADKKGRSTKSKQVDLADVADINKIVLKRGQLAEYWPCTWFSDYVTDAYVRILVGQHQGQMIYRLARIAGLSSRPSSKGYKLERHTTNVKLSLVIGSSKSDFAMDQTSNAPVTDHEFDRFINELKAANSDLPTKPRVEEKLQMLNKYKGYTLTEADISTIINVKKSLARGEDIHYRQKLMNQRDIVLRSGNPVELAAIDQEISEYDEKYGKAPSALAGAVNGTPSSQPAQPRSLEEHRRNLAASIAIGTPKSLIAKQPLAQSRPGSGATTPQKATPASPSNGTPNKPSSSGKPASQPATRFQELLAAKEVEVDLGDF